MRSVADTAYLRKQSGSWGQTRVVSVTAAACSDEGRRTAWWQRLVVEERETKLREY
jgi:hypothetical protein